MIERPPLWYAFFVIVLAVVFFGPRFIAHEMPSHDFIYGWSEQAGASPTSEKEVIAVEGGRMIRGGGATSTVHFDGDGSVRVFLYQVKDGISYPIDPDEVIRYNLQVGTMAPDGFYFVKAEPGLLSFKKSSQFVVVKGTHTVPVDLILPNDPTVEPKFFGWVQK